jgi:molybdopterin-containing oxidoreductase family iron-sulfur binding subunit
MTKYGMVIDLDRCTGCRACMVACKIENNTPESHWWMYVFRLEENEFPNTRVSFLPRPCMHCENAPCVTVCPVEARYHEEEGFVATDRDRCIGCRYCAVACPYGVNYFNWTKPEENQYLNWDDPDLIPLTEGKLPYANPDLEDRYGSKNRKIAGSHDGHGVMGKCTFCVHRVEKGLDPACVSECPAFALHFGDLDDPDSNVSRLLNKKPSWRLLEDDNTDPKVHYISGSPPGEDARQIETVEARE